MANINHHYLKLQAGYLFPEISRRITQFSEANPDAALIRMGIGDVTEPMPAACVEAMQRALAEQGHRETFKGYGPEQGYPWLREKIAEHDYAARGCAIEADEVFISDGSKCDTGNVLDILAASSDSSGRGNVIAVQDPVYPVYVDTNVMAGNTGHPDENGEYEGLVYLRASRENGFVAPLPDGPVDVAYLCFPNNPTGSVATRETLKQWVEYARRHNTLLLFDAAYEAFITDPHVPHSIYEIEGAREVAIEFRSFSKNAGFTGTRCAFTIVPRDLMGATPDGTRIDLHRLWLRRQSTKFNGASYIVQRGAEAVYTDEGRQQIAGLIRFYLENARLIREALKEQGLEVYGGVNAPYVWIRAPEGEGSWDFFDRLLNEAHIVGTPGSGFGRSGEGYFRLSAFNSRDNVEEALRRISRMKLAVS